MSRQRIKANRFDCIALDEFNKALTLNLPNNDLKALIEILETDTKIRKAAKALVP